MFPPSPGKLKPTLKRSTIMMKLTTASILALTMALSGTAWAQTAPSTAPATKPSATAPAVTMDPATEAKFKAADTSGKGVIDGADLEPFKPLMSQIDTDKDGKISRAEYAAAAKAGVIK
jgi:EF hand